MNVMHSVHDFGARISRVQSSLPQGASLVVSNAVNIRYLCGFTGSNGVLVVDCDSAILVTDGRYIEQAVSETEGIEIFEARALYAGIAHVITSAQVYFDPNDVTIAQHERLVEALTERTLLKSPLTIESLRVIKDESEISLIQQACSISTNALTELIESGIVGLTEKAISRRLVDLMMSFGADGPAFDSIVASGPHSAIPHHQPTDRIIAKGDLLKIDFGALVKGYHADCTRTFSVGTPSAWQLETHEAVAASQAAATATVRSGAAVADIAKSAREVFNSLGRIDEFIHGLGHGVGLQIHEDPFLSAADGTRLEENMVITVEPGLYVQGLGGVRIEDTLVVTTSGSKNLTVFPYELIDIS